MKIYDSDAIVQMCVIRPLRSYYGYVGYANMYIAILGDFNKTDGVTLTKNLKRLCMEKLSIANA